MRIMLGLYLFPLASHHQYKVMQPFQMLCIYIGVKEENEMFVGRQLADGATNRVQLRASPFCHSLTPYYGLEAKKVGR